MYMDWSKHRYCRRGIWLGHKEKTYF